MSWRCIHANPLETLKEQEHPDDYPAYWVQGAAVEEQLEQSVSKGQALRMTESEARRKYGNKLVVRLLFDGTHGVPVNSSIKVRDQDRGPAAPDVKRVLRQLASQPGRKFGFKLAVKDAHRLISISPEDWHFLACRVEKGKHVYTNTAGTFGGASAAYWWSRVATAAVRGAHCVSRHVLATWLLLVADDPAMLFHNGRMRESVLQVLVYLRVTGFPLSWKKFAGGEVLHWVGYELLLSEAALGLSTSRALWLEGWYTRLLTAQCRCRSSRRDWVRQRSCAAHWTTTDLSWHHSTLSQPDPPASVKPLPLYALVTLECLRQKIRQRRHCECGLLRTSWNEAWRADARADAGGQRKMNMERSPPGSRHGSRSR